MIICPNCGSLTHDDIHIYNKALRKQTFSLTPIVPTCKHCGADVKVSHICEGGNIIILNGTCGSGKSTVAEMLVKEGYMAIDGDCAAEADMYKSRNPFWNFASLAIEIACEIDILSLFTDKIVLSTVIVPGDMERYVQVLASRNMNYQFFHLRPDYQTAVDRCATRTCHETITEEYWIKRYYEMLVGFDDSVIVVDNTNMSPDETAAYVLGKFNYIKK